MTHPFGVPSRAPRLIRAALCLPMFAVLTPAADAQHASGQQLLSGRVVDESGAPIAGVKVRVTGIAVSQATDSSGRFEFPKAPRGLQAVSIRFPGYMPLVDLVRITRDEPVHALEVILPALHVAEDKDTADVQRKVDARWRHERSALKKAVRAAPHATVFLSEDIDALAPTWISDMFRQVPGFRVEGTGSSARVVARRANCTPTVFIDGLFVSDFRINDLPPDTVRLLLAFRGTGIVPAWFSQNGQDPACGTLAIFSQ